MKLTVARKLVIGIGTLLALILISGLVSLWQNEFIGSKILEITEVEEPTSAAAYEMEINLLGTGFALVAYLHDHDPIHLERIAKDEADFEHFQRIYHELAETEEGKALGVRVDAGYAKFKALADELIMLEDEQTRLRKLFGQNTQGIDDLLDDFVQDTAQSNIDLNHNDQKNILKNLKNQVDSGRGNVDSLFETLRQNNLRIIEEEEKLGAGMSMEIHIFDVGEGMGKFLITRDHIFVDTIRKDLNRFLKYLDIYRSLPLTEQEQGWAQMLSDLHNKRVQLVETIIEIADVKEIKLAEFVILRRSIDDILDDEIQTLTHQNLTQAKDDALKAETRANIIIFTVLIIGLAFGLYIAIRTARSITRPVGKLVEATKAVAEGDHTHRVEIDSGDEFEDLGRSFNHMVEELDRTTVSRDYVENIIQSMAESLIVLSSDNKIKAINPATTALLDYHIEDLFNQPISKISGDKNLINLIAGASDKNGQIDVFETIFKAKNGREIPILFSGSALSGRNNDERVCVALDITKHKQVERAYRELFESAPIAYHEINSEGTIVRVNQTELDMLGYTREEMIGQPVFNFLEDPEISRAAIREKMKGTKPIEGFERKYRRKDGSLIDVYIDERYIYDAWRRITGIRTAMQDITERKKAEKERERLMAELETKNAEMESFTYTVSHDLKSPLFTMKGYLGLLEEDLEEGDKEQLKLDMITIHEAADKMALMLDELLELSHIGRVVNPPKEIPFAELVNEAIELVAGKLAEKEVQVDIDPDLPLVYGDRTRIVEVLQNLLDNAVKYMGAQAEPRVQIGAQWNGDETICYVRDNGVGIDLRYQEKVFQLFEVLDKKVDGTGIGLAVVKRIVEVHGGRIWIESEGDDRGSTFYFTLPQKTDRNI